MNQPGADGTTPLLESILRDKAEAEAQLRAAGGELTEEGKLIMLGEQLCRAIKHCQPTEVESLVAKRADVNYQMGLVNDTPLVLATSRGYVVRLWS